jgi:hypothetical protein
MKSYVAYATFEGGPLDGRTDALEVSERWTPAELVHVTPAADGHYVRVRITLLAVDAGRSIHYAYVWDDDRGAA